MNTNTAGELIAQMPIALNTIQIWQLDNAKFRLVEISSKGELINWVADYKFLTDAILRANQLITEEMNYAQIKHELFKLPFGDRI